MPRYIDADALFKTVNRLFYSAFEVGSKESEKGRFRRGYNVAITDACEAITAAPTISPDEARGAGGWIRIPGFHLDHEYYPARYQCDQCKHFVDSGYDRNYCQNCGAKMKGVSDDA